MSVLKPGAEISNASAKKVVPLQTFLFFLESQGPDNPVTFPFHTFVSWSGWTLKIKPVSFRCNRCYTALISPTSHHCGHSHHRLLFHDSVITLRGWSPFRCSPTTRLRPVAHCHPHSQLFLGCRRQHPQSVCCHFCHRYCRHHCHHRLKLSNFLSSENPTGHSARWVCPVLE